MFDDDGNMNGWKQVSDEYDEEGIFALANQQNESHRIYIGEADNDEYEYFVIRFIDDGEPIEKQHVIGRKRWFAHVRGTLISAYRYTARNPDGHAIFIKKSLEKRKRSDNPEQYAGGL